MPTNKPRIGLTVDPFLFAWISNASQQRGMSMSDFCSRAVEAELARNYQNQKPGTYTTPDTATDTTLTIGRPVPTKDDIWSFS